MLRVRSGESVKHLWSVQNGAQAVFENISRRRTFRHTYQTLSQSGSSSDAVKEVYDEKMLSEAERSNFRIAGLIRQFQRQPGDTGSTPVQIAILTYRIKHRNDHMQRNRKDYCCKRLLVKLVHQRRKLLRYLQAKDYSAYQQLVTDLQLRAPKEEHYPSHAK